MAIHRNSVEISPSGKPIVAKNLAPSDGEMEVYRRRFDEIHVGLVGAGLEEATRRMARFFLLFPMPGTASGMMEDMADAYARVLSVFPLWAIDKACRRVIASGATFRPSAPELRKLADDECRPFHAEAATIRTITSAEPYHVNSENERERVKAGFAALIAKLKTTNVVNLEKTVAEARRDVYAGFPHLQEALCVSDAFKAHIDQRRYDPPPREEPMESGGPF